MSLSAVRSRLPFPPATKVKIDKNQRDKLREMEEGDGGLNATVLADIFYFQHLSRNLSLLPVLGGK